MCIHEINSLIPFTVRNLRESSSQYKKLKKQSEIFYNLDKIYFFEFIEKLAWSNFNNVIIADKLRNPALTSLAYANYGMLLVGMGMFHRAEKSYEKSLEYAEISGDAVVKAISSHRLGMRGMYTNTPFEWREKMQEALLTFEEVSDLFEIYVSITGIAVANVFSGDFSEALKYYRKLEDLAEKHQANRFIAWTSYSIPFYRYLLGEMISSSARAAIKRGIQMAEDINDLLAVATGWNFLCIISIRENDLEKIYDDTLENFKHINKLNLFVPDTHIAYAHSADGALICLQNGIGKQRILKKIIRIAVKKLLNWGKTFSYVYGPAIRIQAQYFDYLGKKDLARKWHLKSIETHEKTDNRWELGLAYFEAAKSMEDQRENFLEKAESVFKDKNILVELERLTTYRNGLKNA
jgi:tetratricopeptide (TPR) repeat protein